jgi:hypothetical protein
MTDSEIIDILLLIARPAAGKSELIHYLKKQNIQTRTSRFHIGAFEELDDFPMLWTWFEEDYILEKLGHPRLHTDADGYFLEHYMWDLLIERLCMDYSKKLRDKPNYHRTYTSIIEFSRGGEHGGYTRAFAHLSQQVLAKLAILYISVPWEESLRKNRARFNPDRPDSILEHGLPDEKLERLYREDDWEHVSARDPAYVSIQGVKVPYIVFDNEDDITTSGGEALGERLEETLGRLWRLYMNLQPGDS